MDHDTYYANLPRRRVGAGMLCTDPDDRVLVVEPTYKRTWEVPGGVVEEGEHPPDAAIREVHEELGIAVNRPRLLVLHHQLKPLPRGDSSMLIYDGGVIDDPSVIRLDTTELASYRFVAAPQLADILTPALAARMRAALRARAEGIVIELPSSMENAERP